MEVFTEVENLGPRDLTRTETDDGSKPQMNASPIANPTHRSTTLTQVIHWTGIGDG